MTRASARATAMVGSALAENDSRWRSVGADDPQRETEHFVNAGRDVAEVQPLDDDRPAAKQHVVSGGARRLEFLDREVIDAEDFDAVVDQMTRAGLGHADILRL